ncbi:hypothetical protein ACHAXR_003343, partial [Thalassiosira sp. AJA248-18]
CDCCGAGFSIEHGLSCSKGGLVIQRHDAARDEAGELSAMALSNGRVSYEPLIFYGKGVTAGQQPEAGSEAEVEVEAARRSNTAGDESRGDVSVHGLWKHGSTCILDIRITDTDSRSYEASTSSKVL